MVVAKGRTERDVAYGPGGLKAGAGLRGPYGTSVRHTWPTWIPPYSYGHPHLRAIIFFSLSFPPFAPIFSKQLSFLDLAQRANIRTRSVLFSFRASISGPAAFCFLFSQTSIVIHPEISRFPFCILCPSQIRYLPSWTYSRYFILIRDAASMEQHSLVRACVCVRPMSLPLFQQTGTRKCLPILLPTEVRSR